MTESNRKSKTEYDIKFAGFIEACKAPVEVVIVNHPEALGDNYDEIVESLNRLAVAQKTLRIVPRQERKAS